MICGVGSSPHARGTPITEAPRCDLSWFIPACAGNAMAKPIRLPFVAVHPRMRGERGIVSAKIASAVGSSPHARGTHPDPAA